MVRKMKVVEHSADWPMLYEEEISLVRKALGSEIVRAHHIGSTGVPGLAAKPIIDMLLEVRSLSRLDDLNQAMEDIGYQPRGESGVPGRRYYPKGGDARTHHVHAFAVGDPHIEVHLAFRDYLRAHPAAVAEYAAVKQQAATVHETDPDGYVACKQWFVERTVAEAVDWAKEDGLMGREAKQENSV